MNTSKYYGENGIHRVPLWRIGGYALNNTATNLYLFMMNYVAYYLVGFVGVATVVATSFSMYMRIWDGVTDPFVGYIVDKTNSRFGKNRPFMVIGNIILAVTSFIMFHVTHLLPENPAIRFAFFIVVGAIYYVGYTFQCVVTKSAQTCMTNDPKQRPMFAAFDAVYNTFLFMGIAILSANIAQKTGGFGTTEFFHQVWLIAAIMSACFTAIAVFSIAPKDRNEFFGTGHATPPSFKDYWEVIKKNRAIQMLIVSASTDKLALSTKTGVIQTIQFAIVSGSIALQGSMSALLGIPSMIVTFLAVSLIPTRIGQKKGMVLSSIGGIIINTLFIVLYLTGDPRSMAGENGISWGTFAICYVILSLLLSACTGISGNLVIPMTADCADYEVYRSGKYVPGLMGTLFSFVDKLISSFAPMITGLLLAAVGFANSVPDINTPYSDSLRNVFLLCTYGFVIVGLICNLIAMKFYPLSKERMEEIREKITEIKAQAQ